MFGTNMETRVSGAKVVKRKRVIHSKSLLFDHNINANSLRKILCIVIQMKDTLRDSAK